MQLNRCYQYSDWKRQPKKKISLAQANYVVTNEEQSSKLQRLPSSCNQKPDQPEKEATYSMYHVLFCYSALLSLAQTSASHVARTI